MKNIKLHQDRGPPRPQPRPKHSNFIIETSRDQDSSLENFKPVTWTLPLIVP